MKNLTKKEFEQEIKKVNYLAKMVYLKGYPNHQGIILHANKEDLGDYLKYENGFPEKENIYKYFKIIKKTLRNQDIIDSGFDIKFQNLELKYIFDIAKKITSEFEWKVFLIEYDEIDEDGDLIRYEEYLIGFEYDDVLYTITRSDIYRKTWANLVDLIDDNKDLDFTLK